MIMSMLNGNVRVQVGKTLEQQLPMMITMMVIVIIDLEEEENKKKVNKIWKI